MKCWEEMQNEVLARTYELHHQIVNAMIVNNCKSDFYTKRVGYTLDAGINLYLTRMEEEYIAFQSTTILMSRIRYGQKTMES